MIGLVTGIGLRTGRRFTPKSIPGIVLWADAAYVVKDSSGNVSQLFDLSGKGNHLTQDTLVNQPLHVPNVLAGRPVVRTDGVNDFLQTPALGFTGDQNMSLFVVYKAVGSIACCGFSGTIGNEGGLYSTSMDFSSKQVRVAGSITVFCLKTYIKATGYLNPAGTMYYNGSGVTTYTGTGAESFIPSYNAASRLQIGRWYTSYGGNDFAEILLYNRAVTAGERVKIENYLRAKYQLW